MLFPPPQQALPAQPLTVRAGDIMPYAAGKLVMSQSTTGKYLGDLKQVSAGTRIGESAQFFVPFHILNLDIVVRHAYSCCVRSEGAQRQRKNEHQPALLAA